MSTVTPSLSKPASKVTIRTFRRKKAGGNPLTMVTAYDYATAVCVENAGLDAILVGDSLGMVVLGYETTLPVTMEDMLHHSRAVARGASTPLLIGDMPFMAYQSSIPGAVANAGRFLQEGGMQAVKLEGGRERSETVRCIVLAGIPVMGHIGLTPQSVHQLGGFRTQGRSAAAAKKLVEDALALQDAGCFSLVLESVPSRLAKLISEKLEIPTIGIGAGAGCDGQVLVLHDLLGFFDRFKPRFVKRYADLHFQIHDALTAYKSEVEDRIFPDESHSTDIGDEEWHRFVEELEL